LNGRIVDRVRCGDRNRAAVTPKEAFLDRVGLTLFESFASEGGS